MQKPIFNGLSYAGMPDFYALYKMPAIPLVTRGWQPHYWTDELGFPPAQYFDHIAQAIVAPCNIIVFDHEQWKYGTPDERQTTAQMYVEVYQQIKLRRPELRIGWYMDPIRRDFWRAKTAIGSPQYLAWQQENNDLGAIMAPYTDVYCPSLYFFYNRDVNPLNMDELGLYVERNIAETKRIRRVYGRMECPIYPYVWQMRHDGTRPLDPDSWEFTLREVLDAPTGADGAILFGGWKPTGPSPWDEAAPWWVTVKARLTDKRRTT